MKYLILTLILPWAAQASIKGADLFSGHEVEVKPGPKGTVVVFLSAKCPCSHSHVGEIKKISKEFGDFQFVGVHANTDEAKDITQEYFKKADLGFPLLRDHGAQLADRFRASKTPHVFVVDLEDKVIYRGGVTDSKNCDLSGRNYLREALTDIQAGRRVRVSESRTLGCAISRGGKSDW